MRSASLMIITVVLFAVAFWLAPSTAAQTATEDAGSALTSPLPDSAAAGVGAPTEAGPNDMPAYPMDPERKAQSIAYSRFVNIWRFVSFFVTVGLLSLVLFTGLSAKLRTWAQRLFQRPFLALWAFFILYLLVDFLLNLPFDIYRGFIVESNYGFMNQTFGGWFGEKLLGLLIMAVLGVVPVWILYWAINKFRRWWVMFTLAAIPLVVLMIVIVPVVINPLFNDFVPIQDQALGTKLTSLAESVGIHDADVFQVDASKQSSKINAYVTGLFGTKRIVLYDTMIKGFSHEEILFVMGHEMGHYVKNHIFWGLSVAILFIAFLLWGVNRTIHPIINRYQGRLGFSRLGDMASLPLIMLLAAVLEFAFQPITNGYSRIQENVCDRYSLDVTGIDGETAARAFDKLAVYNMSDPSPSALVEFWFYDHPALDKRMAFVREYAAQRAPQAVVE